MLEQVAHEMLVETPAKKKNLIIKWVTLDSLINFHVSLKRK